MNAPISISLNGTFIRGRIEGLDQLTVTKRRKDSEKGGGVTTTFSSELTFYDDGYDILKAALLDPPNGFDGEVAVKIYDDECNAVIFDGKILGDAIDWCYPECAIKATIVEIDPLLSCIQSTLIDDNRLGFYNNNGWRVNYCIVLRPEWLFEILSTLGILVADILYVVAVVLSPAVAVISGIVYIVCLAVAVLSKKVNKRDCAKFDPTTSTANWLTESNKLRKAIDPCGRYYNMAKVREYINNVCKICGVNFKSSILNDNQNQIGKIYYNTILFSAPVKKGRFEGSGFYNLDKENAPIETLETLFNNYLNPTFNAKWELIGNDLYFERKDFFNNISQWIDSNDLLNENRVEDGTICYKWSDKQKPSFGRFEYSSDAIEILGNELKDQWRDIVEWNPQPRNPKRKGEYNVTLPFSPCAVVGDEFINDGNIVSQYSTRGSMAMHQQNTLNYRLINVWTNSHTDGDIIGASFGGMNQFGYDDSFTGIPTGLKNYNYPFWFREGIQGVYGYQNNLYSLFHWIDDPRQPNAQKYDFDFTFEYNCAEVAAFSFEKYVRLYVGNSYKNGTVNEITIDYNKRTIKVQGTV